MLSPIDKVMLGIITMISVVACIPVYQAAAISGNEISDLAKSGLDLLFGGDASYLYSRGYNLLYEDGKYEEAITYFDKALAIDPNDIGSLLQKGIALSALGKHEEAITYFDKGLAINASYTPLLFNKGNALADLGKHEEAISYYDKFLAILPNSTYVIFNKALSLEDLGRNEEAITYYDKVLAIEPNYTKALDQKAALSNLTNSSS